MIPELIDLSPEEAHEACEALAKMLRVVPVISVTETEENA